MNKEDVVKFLIRKTNKDIKTARAFAPSNIALCKYWGKRNQVLNLPNTSSFSISLGDKGTTTEISTTDAPNHLVFLNDQEVKNTSELYQRLTAYLDLFSLPKLKIKTHSTIPIAAGLASSASGFAALVSSLNIACDWQLDTRELSILARLGSGSACRSLWQGFVEWHAGNKADGMDSYAEPILQSWPGLCIGLHIVNDKEKSISSRVAMQRTIETSPFYKEWPTIVENDLANLKHAIQSMDFTLLGETSEANAIAMHATMNTAYPPIYYSLPQTLTAMQQVWNLRKKGIEVYFTQDAGPNLKLLFMDKDKAQIQKVFEQLELVNPFN